jgi:hydroxyacylglutathione hydrolase
LWPIPIGTLTIVQAMGSSHNCPTFKWSDLTSTAFAASTTSPIGQMGAQIDLGDRAVDAIPTPGHNETEVSFYDRNTGRFFSGDFLMPGRLLIDDTDAELASAKRVASFVKDRTISFALGGHIELDAAGQMFPWQSKYHPHEHVLQMTKDDLLALPAAISNFNGFYPISGNFVVISTMHVLIVLTLLVAVVLISLVLILSGMCVAGHADFERRPKAD